MIDTQSGTCQSSRVRAYRKNLDPSVYLSHANLFRAYGFFECTHDCTDITSASFLSTVGKKTDVLLRVSTVGPESGSADTSRDVHGWGMKLYTEEGNLDWVFNNTVRSAFRGQGFIRPLTVYHIAYFLRA